MRRLAITLFFLLFSVPSVAPAVTITTVFVVPTMDQVGSAYDAGSVRIVSDNVLTGSGTIQCPVPFSGQVADLVAAKTPAKFDVGIYDEIRSAPGLDGHHVGQKAVMQDFIPGYYPATTPLILIPKVDHTMFLISVPKQFLIPEKALFVDFSA